MIFFENKLSVLSDFYPYHTYYAHAPITQLMFSKCIFFSNRSVMDMHICSDTMKSKASVPLRLIQGLVIS